MLPADGSRAKELRDDTEGHFSVEALLMWRRCVSPLDGFESRLDAKAVEDSTTTSSEERPCRSKVTAESLKALEARERRTAVVEAKAARKSWCNLNARSADEHSCDFAMLRREKMSLKVSDSSWVSQQLARRSATKGESSDFSDEDIVRKMKSILNKLTLEKFSELSRQLISCGIRTTLHLETLILEVFEKATTQHHFISMYADLCAILHSYFAENPIANDSKKNFKKILLNACQASFERHLTPPASLTQLDGEDLAEAELQYKMRMLGNIRFVGALLVRKMLACKVMFAIIEELLGDPTPEALESLASLLTVIGPTFDVPEWPHRVMLTAVFDQLQGIVEKGATSSRVRCLLKDVLELRAASWQDRKPKRMEGPSTLEQVAQKFNAEVATTTSPCNSKAGRSFTNSSPSNMSSGRINRLAADLFQSMVLHILGLAIAMRVRRTHRDPASRPKGGRRRQAKSASIKMHAVRRC
jgi:hypothetical protein